MSDTKISAYPSAATLTGAERLPVSQSNQTRGATVAQILTSSLFTQSGTGAVAESIATKFLQYPRSNTEFASIQAATDSYGNTYANSAGGISLPAGSYNQASTITINNQSGFKFEGAGKYLTVVQATAGAAALPLFKFIDGAYCSVKAMTINALSSGSAIGSAVECRVSATIQPTPQGMIFDELYIDGVQGGGFTIGIRFVADGGQDNNNERSLIKNCCFFKCGTALSIEHYNSLLHQIFGGIIQGCGVGISTANGLGGSFSANGMTFIQNTTADFDIGDNSTHSIDIVNCKSEGTTGLWLRALVTTGRTDVNMLNSTYHGTLNNASVDYRSSGKLLMQGCQLQQTGTTRKISATHASSVLVLIGNFFDIDSVEYAGTLIWGGNKYAGSIPTLTPTATTSRLINLDEPSYSPVTETGATRTVAITDSEIIANRAGTITLTLPDATKFNGRKIRVRTIQAQTVVSASSNVVPLVGGAAGTAILAATAGKWADLKSEGTAWQIMAGN